MQCALTSLATKCPGTKSRSGKEWILTTLVGAMKKLRGGVRTALNLLHFRGGISRPRGLRRISQINGLSSPVRLGTSPVLRVSIYYLLGIMGCNPW